MVTPAVGWIREPVVEFSAESKALTARTGFRVVSMSRRVEIGGGSDMSKRTEQDDVGLNFRLNAHPQNTIPGYHEAAFRWDSGLR